MKIFELEIQEKNNFCLIAVLQTILRKYNINLSQEEIAKNLSSGKNNGFYADDENIVNFMKKNSFDYKFFNSHNIPFNEPDTLLREMNENEGIILLNSHYYLLADFQDPLMKLVDPKDKSIIEKDIYNLIKEMRATNGLFGLIKHVS